MKIMKKLSIVILIITMFNFCAPKKVQAVDWAGKLVEPIVDLVVFLGDGITDIIHDVILDQDTSIVRVDLTESTGKKILAIIGGVIIGVVAAIAVVATAGLAAAAFAAIRSYSCCCICRNGCYGSASIRCGRGMYYL